MVVERVKRCAECGKEFVATVISRPPKYCSDDCRHKARQRRKRESYERRKPQILEARRVLKERRERAKRAPNPTQDEIDERCIAFLQRRAKNVPCTECRCRVLEGEWVSPSGASGEFPDVHVRVWCDKGLVPMVGCPGYECGYPQRRVREFRRKGRGFGTQLVEVNRLTSLLEIDG